MQEYTTSDGWTIRVFSTLYMDWGLEIEAPNGKQAFYSPCALDHEWCGHHWTDPETDEELDEGIPWTDAEWEEWLAEEAWDLIEAHCSDADGSLVLTGCME